jgi:hypothetical protein
MTNLRKALTLLLACAALTALPLAAQTPPDCSFTFNFTGDATQAAQSNLSGNTPCVNWRVTFSTTGTLATTVTFQTSPDGTSWTSVPNTVCSSSAQPPCVIQGTNPLTGTAQGMAYFSSYGNYVRVITSGSSGTGTGAVRGYGAKGASASGGANPAQLGNTLAVNGIEANSVWVKKGAIFSAASEPNLLYEGNAQLLAVPSSTKVFKCWYNAHYAESLTALPGSWTIQGSDPAPGYVGPSVHHIGATYYLIAVIAAQLPHTQIDLLTSANGTSFTLAAANILSTGGTWDNYAISTGQFDFDGTTWRILYQGTTSTGTWQVGLATASSPTGTWTKSVSNPVITTAIGPGGDVGGGVSLYKDGSGNIWAWMQSSVFPGSDLPTDIYRYTSPDWVTWTRNPRQPVLPRTTSAEGVGQATAQVADPTLAEANGSVYMAYSAQPTQTGPFTIGLAIAPLTFAQLVTTDEGAKNGFTSSILGITNDILTFDATGLPADSGVQTTRTDNFTINLTTPNILNASGDIFLTGLSGLRFRQQGWGYLFRNGFNPASGNQAYLSQNYNYATALVDSATYFSSAILMDLTGQSLCLAFSPTVNSAPVCLFTIGPTGITNTPVFKAGMTTTGFTFSGGTYTVNGWPFTFPASASGQVVVTSTADATGLGNAVCRKANGVTGYCSSIVAAGGTCTCN